MGLMNLEENLRVDDEKIKQLIIDVFNEKFKYMSKSNYLRWISSKSISERIKILTVDIMTEEDIEKHPNSAGYYSVGKNYVSLKNVDNKTADHELNHFISDPIEFKNDKMFPRYIDEGITEYLTQNIVKNASYVSYSQNVYFVKLLHSIFGDELIKCYLTGVSHDFYNKLSSLVTGDEKENIDDFEKTLANLMKYNHSQDYDIKSSFDELSEEDANNRITKYIQNILMNSIKEEMIDFNYYDEIGNIDLNLLVSNINARQEIINDLNRHLKVKIDSDISLKLLKHALNYSYLGKYYQNDELNNLIDDCFSDGKLSISKINDLYKDKDNKLFYALEMRIENKNYNEGKSVDFSNLLFDFFKLLATNKFNDRDLYEKLIKTYLYEKIGGNINVDVVSNILKNNFNYFYHVSKIALSNEKNFSDSQIASVNMYMLGIDTYVEKRDKDLFLIEYNKKNDDLTSHKISFSDISYRKDYPHLGHLRLKEGFKYVELYFDENYENVMYKGRTYPINGSFESLIAKRIIEESEITNFEDYIHYLNDGKDDRIEGAHYLGDNFDLLNTNSRFIDYESMCNSIKDRISVFNDGLKKSILKQNIENILKKAYGQMDISDDLVDKITARAFYFTKGEQIKTFDDLNIHLIKDWKNYISNVENNILVEYPNEEVEKQADERIKKEKRIEIIHLANDEFNDKKEQYIVEKNDDYYDDGELTYGIDGIRHRYFIGSPIAKKINYELFISDLIEKLMDYSDDEKNIFFNKYLNNLNNLLGCTNLDLGDILDDSIDKIDSIIKDNVMNNKRDNLEELNNITEEIVKYYSDNKQEMMKKIKNSRIDFDEYTTETTKIIYKKVEEIKENESISETERNVKINTLVELANEETQKNKDSEDYNLSIQMEQIIENEKRKKKVY